MLGPCRATELWGILIVGNVTGSQERGFQSDPIQVSSDSRVVIGQRAGRSLVRASGNRSCELNELRLGNRRGLQRRNMTAPASFVPLASDCERLMHDRRDRNAQRCQFEVVEPHPVFDQCVIDTWRQVRNAMAGATLNRDSRSARLV